MLLLSLGGGSQMLVANLRCLLVCIYYTSHGWSFLLRCLFEPHPCLPALNLLIMFIEYTYIVHVVHNEFMCVHKHVHMRIRTCIYVHVYTLYIYMDMDITLCGHIIMFLLHVYIACMCLIFSAHVHYAINTHEFVWK